MTFEELQECYDEYGFVPPSQYEKLIEIAKHLESLIPFLDGEGMSGKSRRLLQELENS